MTRHELSGKGANSAHLVAIGKLFPSSYISLCFYIVGYLGQNGVYPMFIVVSIFIEIENKEEKMFSFLAFDVPFSLSDLATITTLYPSYKLGDLYLVCVYQ